jgi:hypothetical protein
MAQPTPSLYALDPALPVLLRPDGGVQVGWSPRRAVLIHPPRGLNPAGPAAVLRMMHSPVPMSELQRQADRQGTAAAGELIPGATSCLVNHQMEIRLSTSSPVSGGCDVIAAGGCSNLASSPPHEGAHLPPASLVSSPDILGVWLR